MSVRMLLIAIVALVAPRYFEKVKAHAVGNLTEHLPDGLPTTQSAGVISASVSVPATDSTVDVRVDAIVFWIGCTLAMLLLASCAACHICRCSERRRNSSRRGRRGPGARPASGDKPDRRSPGNETEDRNSIFATDVWHRKATVPVTRSFDTSHPFRLGERILVVSATTTSGRPFSISVVKRTTSGTRASRCNPPPTACHHTNRGAFGSTLRPPVAPWRDLGSPYPALIGLHRSAPPANDFRGYQW
ncbi:hypothetical protein MRX96_014053 [Rhipicephalus microplus]